MTESHAPLKVMVVFGTRPEIIRLSATVRALEQSVREP